MSDRIIVPARIVAQGDEHANGRLALSKLAGGSVVVTVRQDNEHVAQVVLDEAELAHELNCLDRWTVAVELPKPIQVAAPRWENGTYQRHEFAVVLQWLTDDAIGVRFQSDGHESGAFLHELNDDDRRKLDALPR